jgi:hypothetical protein
MNMPPRATNRRSLGTTLRSHFDAGYSFATEAAALGLAGNIQGAVGTYKLALDRFRESRHALASHCADSCLQAIALLDRSLAGEQVDLAPALRPDLGQQIGQQIVREQRAEQDRRDAKVLAASCRVAESNTRRFAQELAELAAKIPLLQVGSAGRVAGEVIQRELLSGTRQVISESDWRLFRQACAKRGL